MERTGFEPPIPVPKRPGLSGGTGSAAKANRAHSKASSTRRGGTDGSNLSLQRRVIKEPQGAFASSLGRSTFGFWGFATFIPTYVGTVAAKAGLSAQFYSAVAGLLGTGVAIVGFVSLGFCGLTPAIALRSSTPAPPQSRKQTPAPRQ